MLLIGLSLVISTEIYSAVMQRVYQNTDNRVGKGFAILGIYLFTVCYCSLFHPHPSSNATILTSRRRCYNKQHYMAIWIRSNAYVYSKQNCWRICPCALYSQRLEYSTLPRSCEPYIDQFLQLQKPGRAPSQTSNRITITYS
jgi:hypothetical protein